MRCVYPDTCIYYREIGKKNIRMVCDYRDGEEIKNIPADIPYIQTIRGGTGKLNNANGKDIINPVRV